MKQQTLTKGEMQVMNVLWELQKGVWFKAMGVTNYFTGDNYCIVSPDGRIVRNSDFKLKQIGLTGYLNYLGIRHCLLQTASPR